MIVYNWNKVLSKSAGKAIMMREILSVMLNLPRNNIYTRNYRKTDFFKDGDSYLLAPKALYEAYYEYPLEDWSNYWFLSSKRNYGDYKIEGKLYLELDRTSIPIEKLKLNRLLTIEKDRIYFKLEEK